MLTFNLKTTFFTVKTSNEVYCCRIYFVNYIQNVHIINRTLHGSLEDMDFMFSWQEQYLTRSLRSLVRYCSCHSNIKSISSRNRVISYIYGLPDMPVALLQAYKGGGAMICNQQTRTLVCAKSAKDKIQTRYNTEFYSITLNCNIYHWILKTLLETKISRSLNKHGVDGFYSSANITVERLPGL